MALDFGGTYSPRATPADGDYPYGSGQDVTVPNDDTGTPYDKQWLNDVLGILQSILVESAITPSGNPDTVVNSDYRDAMRAMFGGVFETRDGVGVRALAASTTVKLNQFVTTVGKTAIGDGLGAFYRIVAGGTGAPSEEFINIPGSGGGLQAQRIEMQKWRNDEIITALELYADNGDAATLVSANGYADAGDAATLIAANAYTDSQVGGSAAILQDYVEELVGVAPAVASVTIDLAKTYAVTCTGASQDGIGEDDNIVTGHAVVVNGSIVMQHSVEYGKGAENIGNYTNKFSIASTTLSFTQTPVNGTKWASIIATEILT